MNNKPRKKDFIQRAHSNPFADQNLYIPPSPQSIPWSSHFPSPTPPTILDLGCGYGRYLHILSSTFPSTNIVGFEIRKKVCEYASLATSHLPNVTVFCTNGMLFIQNFFLKESLKKIFVLFPDPHFKVRKRKARIISRQMLDMFYYLLEKEGVVYVSTDVEELFGYMEMCFEEHRGYMKRECDMKKGVEEETDEARRAGVKSGKVYSACYGKI